MTFKERLESHTTLFLLLAYTFIITIIRGIRMPSDWGKAHWYITYKFGFIKRAFLGTVMSPIMSETNFYILTTLALIILYIALFTTTYKFIKNNVNFENILIVAFFITSPYIVMSSHLIGYLDNILTIIALFSCYLLKSKNLILISLLQIVGVLVHENYLMFGLPIVLFYTYIKYILENDYLSDEKTNDLSVLQINLNFLKKYYYLILCPIFAFVSIALYQALFINLDETNIAMVTFLNTIPFIGYQGVYNVPIAYTTTFKFYLQSQSRFFIFRLTDISTLVVIQFPIVLIYINIYKKMFQNKYINFKFKKFVFTMIVFLVQSPLLLFIIAWDRARIWTHLYLLIFLFYSIVEKYYNKKEVKTDYKYKYEMFVILFLYICLNMIMQFPLMDKEKDKINYLQKVILYSPLFVYLYKLLKNEYQNKYKKIA